MNNWSEILLNFISNLNNLDLAQVIFFCFAYFIVMWFIATIWVYVDAKKRYKNTGWIIFVTLMTAPFNVPWLILYVLMRPEHTKEDIDNITSTVTNIFIKDGRLLPNPNIQDNKLDYNVRSEHFQDIPTNLVDNIGEQVEADNAKESSLDSEIPNTTTSSEVDKVVASIQPRKKKSKREIPEKAKVAKVSKRSKKN